MGNWQQHIIATEERNRQRKQGLERPFGMAVQSISSDAELMKVFYFGNRDRSVQIVHPFVSTGSWIRAMPEPGANYVATYRIDETQPQPVCTVQRQSADRVDAYRKGLGLYRPLQSGEIEVSSAGLAQAYYSRRTKFEQRAGALVRWADQDRLVVGDRSPIHQKQFLKYQSNTIGDEHRLGVVSRPVSSWEVKYPKIRNNYAAEEYLSLLNPAGTNPTILFREHRGHVLDEKGTQIKHAATQVPLRYKAEYFANGDSSTNLEIDEKGNFLTTLATEASEGYELRIPSGNYRKYVKLDETATVGGNRVDAVSKSVTHTVGENYTKTAKMNIKMVSERAMIDLYGSGAKVRLNAGQVAIGAGGIELLQKISDSLDKIATWAGSVGATHTHIGNLGIPTMPPQQADQYVKLQTDLVTIKADIDTIKGSL